MHGHGEAAAQPGESDEHQAQAVCGVHLVVAIHTANRKNRKGSEHQWRASMRNSELGEIGVVIVEVGERADGAGAQVAHERAGLPVKQLSAPGEHAAAKAPSLRDAKAFVGLATGDVNNFDQVGRERPNVPLGIDAAIPGAQLDVVHVEEKSASGAVLAITVPEPNNAATNATAPAIRFMISPGVCRPRRGKLSRASESA